METLLSFALEPSWWNWYLAGVVLLILEIVMPGMWVMWIGMGALVAGLASHIAGGLPIPVQWIIFAVVSIISMFLGRRWFKARTENSKHTLNNRMAGNIGRTVRLEEPIEHGRGKIRIDDTIWTVTGPPCQAGSMVRVVGVENGYFKVEPLPPQDC